MKFAALIVALAFACGCEKESPSVGLNPLSVEPWITGKSKLKVSNVQPHTFGNGKLGAVVTVEMNRGNLSEMDHPLNPRLSVILGPAVYPEFVLLYPVAYHRVHNGDTWIRGDKTETVPVMMWYQEHFDGKQNWMLLQCQQINPVKMYEFDLFIGPPGDVDQECQECLIFSLKNDGISVLGLNPKYMKKEETKGTNP